MAKINSENRAKINQSDKNSKYNSVNKGFDVKPKSIIALNSLKVDSVIDHLIAKEKNEYQKDNFKRKGQFNDSLNGDNYIETRDFQLENNINAQNLITKKLTKKANIRKTILKSESSESDDEYRPYSKPKIRRNDFTDNYHNSVTKTSTVEVK